MYPNDLETDLVQECVHFQGHLSSERILIKPDSGSLKSLSSFLRNQNLENIYPNLDIAVRMALCIPATNCSGERSFSCLKRVKNYLRSTLCQEKLNALALLCILCKPFCTHHFIFQKNDNKFIISDIRFTLKKRQIFSKNILHFEAVIFFFNHNKFVISDSKNVYTRSLQSMATVKYLENGFLEILEIWYGVKSI
jgi:hypothetical protein